MTLESRLRPAVAIAFALSALAVTASASAQERADPATLVVAQKQAMSVFAAMDGVWRGSAWTLLPSGQKREITQTERIGPFLDGSVKVIEGRGYEADGRATFNAFGIVSYDPASQSFSLRSYALGRTGDFPFRPTADGYAWDIVTPTATIHYVATIRDGTLREVGDLVAPGRDPVRIFEMNLRRIGDNDWPAAGQIPPR